jgi:hypothetical protein
MPAEFEDARPEIDHIVAEKHRGPTSPENLALSCFQCNSYKGPNIAGIDPATGATTPLFHPRLQKWHDHFRYDGAILTGQTPEGRTTVVVLEINLPTRAAHREALIEEGVFPPSRIVSS